MKNKKILYLQNIKKPYFCITRACEKATKQLIANQYSYVHAAL